MTMEHTKSAFKWMADTEMEHVRSVYKYTGYDNGRRHEVRSVDR